MSAPTLPFKEQLKIYAGSFLLTLVIYMVIDMYVPIKKLIMGAGITMDEAMTHLQFYKKAPFIILITILMGRSTVRKRTQKLAAAPTANNETVVQ